MKNPWKLLGYALGGVLGIWLTVRYFLPIGLPFLFGYGLAALSEPIVRVWTKKSRFPRGLAAFFLIVLLAAALSGLLWLLGRALFGQVEALAIKLPELLASMEAPLAKLQGKLLHLAAKLPDSIAPAAAEWLERLFEGGSVLAETVPQWILALAGNILAFVPEIVLFLLTMFLSAYLITAERPKLRTAIEQRLPQSWRERLAQFRRRLKATLGGYLRAQLRLMLVMFGLLAAGLLLLLRGWAALPLAALVAVIDALPVFGSGTVLIPWGIIEFLRGETVTAVGLLVLYGAAALTRAFLEPKFLGRQIGLHPLLTLISMYAGFRLFGILGLIFVPVGVILVKQLYDLSAKEENSPPKA